jgi:cellobiose-specific phosphotransferase system component IIC
MGKITLGVSASFILVAGLIFYGFTLFAEYYAKGRWAKNVTGLLAGLGMLSLAAAVMLVPQNADELARISRQTAASTVFLGISSGLLLAAIAAFGVVAYTKPLRLWHERKIERELHRGLPKIP